MYSTRMKTSGIALAVLCAASALTLAAPKTVRAQSYVQTVEAAQEIAGICTEQYRVEFVLQRLGAYLAIADQPGPEPHAAHRTQPDKMVRAERSEERRVGKECRSRWSPVPVLPPTSNGDWSGLR